MHVLSCVGITVILGIYLDLWKSQTVNLNIAISSILANKIKLDLDFSHVITHLDPLCKVGNVQIYVIRNEAKEITMCPSYTNTGFEYFVSSC